jgi:hypothetical protein
MGSLSLIGQGNALTETGVPEGPQERIVTAQPPQAQPISPRGPYKKKNREPLARQ